MTRPVKVRLPRKTADSARLRTIRRQRQIAAREVPDLHEVGRKMRALTLALRRPRIDLFTDGDLATDQAFLSNLGRNFEREYLGKSGDVVDVRTIQYFRDGELLRYGLKVFGIIKLLGLQKKSPYLFEVPPGFGLPARSRGSYTRDDVRYAFDELTYGIGKRTALLVRSSHLDEKSGENPTLFVTYDPADPEASFESFYAAVEDLAGVSEDMGILLMPLVGESFDLTNDVLRNPAFETKITNQSIGAVRRRFDVLVSGVEKRSVITLTRIGAERKTETLFFDPEDIHGSYSRFEAAVMNLVPADQKTIFYIEVKRYYLSNLGVERKTVVGPASVSFVASTEEAFHPDEMHLAVVHGLGTTAVDDDNVVEIIVDRKTGRVLSFGNRSISLAMAKAGTVMAVLGFGGYAQKRFAFFDPDFGSVRDAFLRLREFGGPPVESAQRYMRDWSHRYNLFDDGTVKVYNGYEKGVERVLGMIPFGDIAMFSRLVSLLQFFHTELGRAQIEGTFLGMDRLVPILYQATGLSERVFDDSAINIASPFMRSEKVLGVFEGTIPLVLYSPGMVYFGDVSRELVKLDKRFRETGYILIAFKHTRELIKATPHCKVRVSMAVQNSSSHVATFMRDRVKRERGKYLFAMEPELDPNQMPESEEFYPDRNISVYSAARVVSNGREMAIEILPKEEDHALAPQGRGFFNRLYNLWKGFLSIFK